MTATSTRRRLFAGAVSLAATVAGAGRSRAAEAPSRLFDAVDTSKPGHVIGQMRLDGGDRLSVVSAESDGRSRLDRVAAEMNGKPVLHVDVVPPPATRLAALQTQDLPGPARRAGLRGGANAPSGEVFRHLAKGAVAGPPMSDAQACIGMRKSLPCLTDARQTRAETFCGRAT